MTITNGTNLELMVNGLQGEAHYSELMKFFRGIDGLVQCSAIAISNGAPVSPSDGNVYIVGDLAYGDWAGHEGKIARYSSVILSWEYYAPKTGWLIYLVSSGSFLKFNGSDWVTAFSGGGGSGNMNFIGNIDCSANPNYPAANLGDFYIVSVTGKIGGSSGLSVNVNDFFICNTNTISGNQATVGSKWNVIYTNYTSMITSPDTSTTVNNIVVENGTDGKSIKQSLASVDNSGSINIPSGQHYKINGTALSKNDISGIGSADSPEFTGLNLSSLTAGQAVVADSSKNLVSYDLSSALSGKQNIIGSPTNGDIVTINSSGQVQDSGKKFNDSGSTTGDIWSADKTNSAINAAISALSGWMVYKGVIDCSGNPNYPAAALAEVYIVSVAGKIGGSSGLNVEIGDMLICKTASSAGIQSGVGSNWDIIQANIDGSVTSTDTSTTVNNIVVEAGSTGKTVKQSLASIDTSGSINIPSGQTYKINGSALAQANIVGLTTSDSPTFAGINLSGQSASRVAIFDVSKNLISADPTTYPTLAEFAYLKNVTSAIQTQFDARRYNFLPTVSIYSAGSTSQTLTAGTPVYYAIPVLQDGIINSLEIKIGAFTSNADFELGVYSYTSSGNVSKITSGNVTVTSTGYFSATMASPVTVNKTDLRIIFAVLQKNGTCTPYMQTSIGGAVTDLLFKGATLQSSLPAIETTRASINYAMYVQPR